MVVSNGEGVGGCRLGLGETMGRIQGVEIVANDKFSENEILVGCWQELA